jgi:hypothetical protein
MYGCKRKEIWFGVGMYQKSGFGLGANECGVEDVPDVRLG